MRIPPIKIDNRLLKLIVEIATLSKQIHEQDHPLEYLKQIDRASLLRSALYSARIEGNPLEEHTIESGDTTAKREIFNLVDAANYIRSLPPRQPLTKEEILRLHAIVMNGLSADAGSLRNEQNAIFDTDGAVRYLPPPPLAMRKDIQNLITFVHSKHEFPLVTALVAHLFFEKIHPFIDGNGRVGRLLIPFIQKSYDEHFPLVVPFERYLETHRDEYYYHLDRGTRGMDEYLQFMLLGIRFELEELKDHIRASQTLSPDRILLSDRQRELLAIIEDHAYISMNMLTRRFLRVPPRTIRYDVAVLLKRGLIRKVGTTRGVQYIRNSKS